MEVNMRGIISFVHAILPSMAARGTGVVISVTSTWGSHYTFQGRVRHEQGRADQVASGSGS